MSRLILFFVAFASFHSVAYSQQRLFTNKEGVQITAEIVSISADWRKMTIRKDGNSFDIEPNILVLDDQQWVKDWLILKGFKMPSANSSSDPAAPPVEAPIISSPEIDLLKVQLKIEAKRKLVDSDRARYDSTRRLETKKYAYEIAVTNLGREPLPAVNIEYAIVWKESVSFTPGLTSYTNFSSTKNEFSLKGKKQLLNCSIIALKI